MAIQTQLVTDQNLGFSLSGPHHDSIVETGGGFNHSFLIPQRQQLMPLDDDRFRNSNQHKNQSSFMIPQLVAAKDQQSVLFSQSLATQIEKQRMETERFISLQNERLRQALQEQRKNQISVIMKHYESKTRFLLEQKDEEISKAKNRTMELENFLKRMEMENQTWQQAAKEKEAIAASLNSTIQRLRETACLSINAAEDAESCFRSNEDEEKRKQDTRKMICRCCDSRKACCIMLPCRHLCSCKDCEPFLDSCPVCKTVKKASIEALIL